MYPKDFIYLKAKLPSKRGENTVGEEKLSFTILGLIAGAMK